jgi:hypothetical protein
VLTYYGADMKFSFVKYSAALKQIGYQNRAVLRSLCMFSNPFAGVRAPGAGDPSMPHCC